MYHNNIGHIFCVYFCICSINVQCTMFAFKTTVIGSKLEIREVLSWLGEISNIISMYIHIYYIYIYIYIFNFNIRWK